MSARPYHVREYAPGRGGHGLQDHTKLSSVANGAEEGADAATPKKKTPKTYRLRGLPPVADVESVRKGLCEKLHVDNIKIHSYCDDSAGAAEKVATVEFLSATPGFLLVEAEDEDWTFEYDQDTRLTFDTHFSGFTPLYHPEDPNDYEMDFIAIHGLGGHPLGSWKDRRSSHVWIRDSLRQHFPKCRVLIYGYRTRVVDSESFETIPDIAAHFCSLLLDVRMAETSRRKPIIFAAHSLGGLVLKTAIARMKTAGDDELFCLRSTHSILCFGVPKQGMDTSHMLAMIKGQENLPLVISLSRDPQSLQPINDNFNDAFPYDDSVVVSFYETQISPTMQQGHDGKPVMTGKGVVLVDQWSADNSRKHLKEPRIPINRNHSNMVKFSARDDLYPVVRRELKKLVAKAVGVIDRRLSTAQEAATLDPADALNAGARSSSPVSSNGETNNLQLSAQDTVPVVLDPLQVEGRYNKYETTIRVLEMLNVAMMPMSTKEEREEALVWAADLGNLDSIEYILDRRTDPDTQSADGMTVLGIAARNGHAGLLQLLLNRGANINLKDRHSRTALFFAAGHGHLDIVTTLVEQGALLQTKTHARAKPTSLDMTPLMNAARFGQIDVAEYLLDEGADINARSVHVGYGALHYAAVENKVEAVSFLLEKGASVNLRTAAFATALILAVAYCSRANHRQVVLALIKAGANLDAQDNAGFTALHYAVTLNNVEMCHTLVSEGADIAIKGPHGRTVLHFAVYQGDQKLLNTLLGIAEDDLTDDADNADGTSRSSNVIIDISEMLDDYGFSPFDLNFHGLRPPASLSSSYESSYSTSSSTSTVRQWGRSSRRRRRHHHHRRHHHRHDDSSSDDGSNHLQVVRYERVVVPVDDEDLPNGPVEPEGDQSDTCNGP